MYCVENFTSKKALKDALAAGREVRVFQPGPFGPAVPDGCHALEGPHSPEPHRWYAVARIEDGRIVALKRV